MQLLYAIGVLFALTQGPVLQVWWIPVRDEGIPVNSAVLATYVMVQLPALWMLASSGLLRGRIDGALRWLLVLIAWLVCSVSWATLSTHSIVEALALVVTVGTGLWFATRFDVWRLLWAVWSAMQIGLLASAFAIWRDWPGAVSGRGEWVGIYFNRNSLAPPAAVAVVASIWLAVRLLASGRRLSVAGLLVVAGLDCYVLVRTSSETLAMAGAIGLATSGIAWWSWRREVGGAARVLWRAVSVAAVALPWAFTFGARNFGGWLDEWRSGGRQGLWQLSLDGFREKPLFGWGWLSAWHTPQFFPRELWNWWRTLGGTWSHSAYFDILLGGGLVAFLLFVVTTLGALLGRRGTGAHPVHAGLAVLVLGAMTQESFFIGSHFLTVLLIAGLFSPRLAPAVRASAPTAR